MTLPHTFADAISWDTAYGLYMAESGHAYRAGQDQAVSEADDKQSRIMAAAKAVAMQRRGAPTESESIQPIPASRPG